MKRDWWEQPSISRFIEKINIQPSGFQKTHLISDEYMESNRKPTEKEIEIIEILINNSSFKASESWKENILVREMDDGKMGSLLLLHKNNKHKTRSFGEQISEYQFEDSDGIEVIVSLNLDTHGNLHELDVWKTDYSEVIRYP